MQRALVIGRAVSTAKHPSLEGCRLLVMQPLGVSGRPDGEPLIVIDTLGARAGTVALISSDGKAAREIVGSKASPVRYFTLGLEDS